MNQTALYQTKPEYAIAPADLKSGIEAGEALAVIDARSVERFLTEHVAGAMSFPQEAMDAESLATLDPAFVYVVYGDDTDRDAPAKAAQKLSAQGLNARELAGGIDGWKREGYEIEGVKMACCGGRAGDGASCGCH